MWPFSKKKSNQHGQYFVPLNLHETERNGTGRVGTLNVYSNPVDAKKHEGDNRIIILRHRD